MISRATVQRATVLMNRKMNAERRFTKFGPLCSNVVGMLLHHLELTHAAQDWSAAVARRIGHCRVVVWSFWFSPAMDFVRDERIRAANDRSPANCHPKSEMGTVGDHVARFTKCVAQCYFDRWHVCVHCSGNRAQPDIGYLSSSLLAHRCAWRATTADGEHAGWHGRARL